MSGSRENRVMVLTPPGAGAIAVIRVVGPDATAIVGRLLCRVPHTDPAAGNSASGGWLQADGAGPPLGRVRLRYGRLLANGEYVDDVVTSRLSPDSVEICTHGGVRVVERILKVLESNGITVCNGDESGAAIWRAGNIIEQEAIEALSRVKTHRAVRFLAWQRAHLTRHFNRIATVHRTRPDEARKLLRAALERCRCARILVDGAKVAILGPPNTGKSTLLNHLVGRFVTITSPHAGTTRDWVSAVVDLDGLPLTLVDTAGWREARDGLEHEAIEFAKAIVEQADLRLLVLDGSQSLAFEAHRAYDAYGSQSPCLVVANKADLGRVWDVSALTGRNTRGDGKAVYVSALTGTGMDRLAQELRHSLGFAGWSDAEPALFTQRQRNIASRLLSDGPDSPEAFSVGVNELLLIGRRPVTPASSGL